MWAGGANRRHLAFVKSPLIKVPAEKEECKISFISNYTSANILISNGEKLYRTHLSSGAEATALNLCTRNGATKTRMSYGQRTHLNRSTPLSSYRRHLAQTLSIKMKNPSALANGGGGGTGEGQPAGLD